MKIIYAMVGVLTNHYALVMAGEDTSHGGRDATSPTKGNKIASTQTR